MSDLPHLTRAGDAHIVDISGKDRTQRVAVAEGYIEMKPATLEALEAGNIKKGDALAAARIAGIMASKRTAELVPLCHPIALSSVEVELEIVPKRCAVYSRATAKTVGPTGVEMEALTAVQVSLLTVYDMCKGMDRFMRMTGIALVHKSGGRSGDWNRDDDSGTRDTGEEHDST